LRSEPCWLTVEDVISLNQLIVAASEPPEPHSVLNRGGLESAISRARNHFEYDAEEDALCLAVTLCIGLLRNHAFQQGNKRTAFEAMVIFLNANGYDLDVPDGNTLAQIIIGVVNRVISESKFENVMRHFLVELSDA
jgi:death-on-curing protein